MRKGMDAFEIWIWKRMEKIIWTEHKTSADVLAMIRETEP